MERVVPGTSKALGCHLVFIDTYGNTNFMVIDQQLELKIFTFYESFYFQNYETFADKTGAWKVQTITFLDATQWDQCNNLIQMTPSLTFMVACL